MPKKPKPSAHQLVTQGMGKSLSGNEIQRLLDMPVNIIRYRDLYEAGRLEDVMPAVILFEIESDFGHWTGLYEDDGGNLVFHDSYGYQPDSELFFVPKGFRAEAGQDYPALTALMIDWQERHPDNRVVWNEHRIQGKDKKISTCGRHVALRMLLRNLDLDEYHALLKRLAQKSGTSCDWVVTALTTPGVGEQALAGAIMGRGRTPHRRR